MAQLRKNATSLVKSRKHVGGIVADYEANTASERFADAVRFAYKWAAREKV